MYRWYPFLSSVMPIANISSRRSLYQIMGSRWYGFRLVNMSERDGSLFVMRSPVVGMKRRIPLRELCPIRIWEHNTICIGITDLSDRGFVRDVCSDNVRILFRFVLFFFVWEDMFCEGIVKNWSTNLRNKRCRKKDNYLISSNPFTFTFRS